MSEQKFRYPRVTKVVDDLCELSGQEGHWRLLEVLQHQEVVDMVIQKVQERRQGYDLDWSDGEQRTVSQVVIVKHRFLVGQDDNAAMAVLQAKLNEMKDVAWERYNEINQQTVLVEQLEKKVKELEKKLETAMSANDQQRKNIGTLRRDLKGCQDDKKKIDRAFFKVRKAIGDMKIDEILGIG